ncbi:MAG: hypothetical protein WBB82_05055, partial [Limnothrix sp.]
DQARRNTPIVDDDRPVGRVYRAELDQIEPYQAEDRYERRLRGYEEPRPSRSRGYEDDVPAPRTSRPSRNRPPVDGDRPTRPTTAPTNRRPTRPAPSRRPTRDSYDDRGYDNASSRAGVTDVWSEDAWDEGGSVNEAPRRPRPGRPRPEDEAPRRPRRPRSDQYGVSDEDVATVDYQPIDSVSFDDDQDWDDQAPDDVVNNDGDRPNPPNPVNFDY